MAKGSQYERDICVKLSKWFSGGEVDDLFWRTSQSGGRATTRRQKGKKTRAHCGDICALDADGAPLTKLVTIECKKGYKNSGLMDAIDRPKRLKPQLFETFIYQAIKAAKNAGTPYWMLIHRRSQKDEMVYLPYMLRLELESVKVPDKKEIKKPRIIAELRIRTLSGWKNVWVFGCKLDAFLEHVAPKTIRKVLKKKELEHAARK